MTIEERLGRVELELCGLKRQRRWLLELVLLIFAGMLIPSALNIVPHFLRAQESRDILKRILDNSETSKDFKDIEANRIRLKDETETRGFISPQIRTALVF